MEFSPFRKDSPVERQAREDGFACAQLELQSGHPGYFYSTGDGDYLYAMDPETGLPIFSYGDCLTPGCVGWVEGFNAGTRRHIAEHGLPWNSRREHISELTDIASYFLKRAQAERPACLSLDGPPQSSADGSVSLELIMAPLSGFGTGDDEVSVALSAPRLYHGGHAGAYRGGRTTATEHSPAVTGTGQSTKPFIQPGTKEIWLCFFNGARTIEFFWGPAGSELCFFRFAAFRPRWGRPSQEPCFAALDLQLGDWIPGRGQRLGEDKF